VDTSSIMNFGSIPLKGRLVPFLWI